MWTILLHIWKSHAYFKIILYITGMHICISCVASNLFRNISCKRRRTKKIKYKRNKWPIERLNQWTLSFLPLQPYLSDLLPVLVLVSLSLWLVSLHGGQQEAACARPARSVAGDGVRRGRRRRAAAVAARRGTGGRAQLGWGCWARWPAMPRAVQRPAADAWGECGAEGRIWRQSLAGALHPSTPSVTRSHHIQRMTSCLHRVGARAGAVISRDDGTMRFDPKLPR